MPKSSLGDLVDRLSIANLKIWFCQDEIYRLSNLDLEEFSKEKPEKLHATIKKLAAVNLQRNELAQEIDQCLADAVSSGRAHVEKRVKLT